MHIDPKVERWLRKLLFGVENSNNAAEVVATEAHAAITGDLLPRAFDICDRIGDGPEDGSPLALEALQLAGDIRAALEVGP